MSLITNIENKKDIIHAKQEMKEIKMSLEDKLKEYAYQLPVKVEKTRMSFGKKIAYFALGILTFGLMHANEGRTETQVDVNTQKRINSANTGQYGSVKFNPDNTMTPGSKIGNSGYTVHQDGTIAVDVSHQFKKKEQLTNSQKLYNSHNKTDYQRRIAEYDAMIRQDPKNAKLFIEKANEQISNKVAPQEIINTLKTAITYHPNNEELHMRLGNYFLANGNYKESSKEFEKVIKINPSMSKGLSHLKTYFKSKNINFN